MMLTPTLAAARAALPPEGANPPWGGPAVDCVATTLAATWWGGGYCPHARHCLSFAAPWGGLIHLGAARRWIPLPPRLPLRVLRCPEGANPALGRPGGGVVAPMLVAARAVLMHGFSD